MSTQCVSKPEGDLANSHQVVAFANMQSQLVASWGPPPGERLGQELGIVAPRFHARKDFVPHRRVIGKGSFGTVAGATVILEDGTSASGALKVSEHNMPALEALTKELKRLTALAGTRGIPRILGWASTDDGQHVAAILMELMSCTLLDVTKARHREAVRHGGTNYRPLFQPGEYWPVVVDLAEIISAVHERGILHLDLKPANIGLDEQGRLYLLDFGLSRKTHRSRWDSKVIEGPVGTDGFMDPQLAARGVVPMREDLDTQAFALTIVQLVTGLGPKTVRRLHRDELLRKYLPQDDPVLYILVNGVLQQKVEWRIRLKTWLLKRPMNFCERQSESHLLALIAAAVPPKLDSALIDVNVNEGRAALATPTIGRDEHDAQDVDGACAPPAVTAPCEPAPEASVSRPQASCNSQPDNSSGVHVASVKDALSALDNCPQEPLCGSASDQGSLSFFEQFSSDATVVPGSTESTWRAWEGIDTEMPEVEMVQVPGGAAITSCAVPESSATAEVPIVSMEPCAPPKKHRRRGLMGFRAWLLAMTSVCGCMRAPRCAE